MGDWLVINLAIMYLQHEFVSERLNEKLEELELKEY